LHEVRAPSSRGAGPGADRKNRETRKPLGDRIHHRRIAKASPSLFRPKAPGLTARQQETASPF
jgi:hypothetical protein